MNEDVNESSENRSSKQLLPTPAKDMQTYQQERSRHMALHSCKEELLGQAEPTAVADEQEFDQIIVILPT